MRCAKEQRMHFEICSLNQFACHSVPNQEAYERRLLFSVFFTKRFPFPTVLYATTNPLSAAGTTRLSRQ